MTVILAFLIVIVAGCEKPAPEKDSAFQLTSPAFEPGMTIPKKHTGEGKDVSPELKWASLPEGTRSLALICDDPDAPRDEPWVHWVIFNIDPKLDGLPEGYAGAVQGTTDFGRPGYGGPMPPPGSGIHRYYFKLYALSGPVDLNKEATKKDLLKAMEGKTMGTAELVGTYQR
jgi:Raf kinase inhibitor-like YbhB/YbcL family protein